MPSPKPLSLADILERTKASIHSLWKDRQGGNSQGSGNSHTASAPEDLTSLLNKTFCQGVCSPKHPKAEHIVFIKTRRDLAAAPQKLKEVVSAILISEKIQDSLPADLMRQTCVLMHPQPERAFITLLEYFNPYRHAHESLHVLPATMDEDRQTRDLKTERTFIGPSCLIGAGVNLGVNLTLMGNNVIGAESRIGDRVTLYPGVILYPGTVIGDDVVVHSGTVIGGDGFGYEETEAGLVKIPQIGHVQIGDRCEIGTNVAIDRGTIDATLIGSNVKIDNLVQIAHNVVIGNDSIIVAQSGIAGSSVLGRRVILAGQVGISDHCSIGDDVRIGAQSGVLPRATLPQRAQLMGSPVVPYRQFFKRERFLDQALDQNKNK